MVFLGYIVPNKFMKVASAFYLRLLIAHNKNHKINEIISFGANQIFEDKTTYTTLLILQKQENPFYLKYYEVRNLKNWKTRKTNHSNLNHIYLDTVKSYHGWHFLPRNLEEIFETIKRNSKSLKSLIGSQNIYNGIQTSANRIYIHKPISEDDEYIYFKKDKKEWKIEKELTKPYFQTSKGKDNLYTYRPLVPNSFVIYPYKYGNLINIEELKDNYPYLFQYLMFYKDKLDNPKRDIKPTPKTDNEWYRYGRHQSLNKCDVPAKIVVGVLSQGDKYAIDYNRTFISSGGTAGYTMITMPPRGTKVLEELPIRSINFRFKRDKELHDNIANTQKNLIAIQIEIDNNSNNRRKLTPLKRQFQTQKNHLDQLLKELYGLGENDKLIPLISEIYATN